VARAKALTDQISKVLDAPMEESNGDEVGNEDGNESHVEPSDPAAADAAKATFDPAAYSMVRNELNRRQSRIQRGYNWAASAKLLFEFSKGSDENVRRLAIGTLYYGQLSAVDVWQILQSVLPELKPSMDGPSNTCGSPWAGSCPPKQIDRNGVKYPPGFILDPAVSFCEKELASTTDSSGETQGLCEAGGTDAAEILSIPSSIPNGYYGYTAPSRRPSEDPLSQILFTTIDSLSVDSDGMKSLDDQKRSIEKDKRDLQRTISDTWKDIGGQDGDQMGENGELHALADKCYDVLAGKYTYEVCIFGGAVQKEGSGGGTSLGHWKGTDRDPETGDRMLLWTDGQKCWNGPKRSATVYVTCGSETKLISADEPETCTYVLEMTSHIACDDEYKSRQGL
jgi:protein kinase C substrate 80K-H